jgi:hypothetical protein
VVREWTIDGPAEKAIRTTAIVGVTGGEWSGSEQRISVEKGQMFTVTAQVCGAAATCAEDPTPTPASAWTNVVIQGALAADPPAFTIVAGDTAEKHLWQPNGKVSWRWVLVANATGSHEISVQLNAVARGSTITNGEDATEFAVQTAPTVADLIGRRSRGFFQFAGPTLVVLAIAAALLGWVVYVRRRRDSKASADA